jgi:hypothetical protein
LIDRLAASLDSPDPDAREAALLAIAQLPAATGRAAEPYLLPLVPSILERATDKAAPARDAAAAAGAAVARSLCPHAAEMVLPVLFEHTDPLKKWQVRELALKMLAAVSEVAPRQVAARLPEIVPLIATLMVDAREQVRRCTRARGAARLLLPAACRLASPRFSGRLERPEHLAPVASRQFGRRPACARDSQFVGMRASFRMGRRAAQSRTTGGDAS